MSTQKRLSIKLTKSPIGAKPNHRATVATLRLRKMGQVVEFDDNPCVRGMINKVRHLVTVEELV